MVYICTNNMKDMTNLTTTTAKQLQSMIDSMSNHKVNSSKRSQAIYEDYKVRISSIIEGLSDLEKNTNYYNCIVSFNYWA